MALGALTSHHLNYLIWRYLQESGHGEAAILLQRAWNPDPQTLPFAPYIKTHALVTLVQKGLQYDELEKSLDEQGNAIPSNPNVSFFGPSPDTIDDAAATEKENIANSTVQKVSANGQMDEAFVPEATRESPRNEHDDTSIKGDIDDKHQSSLISPNVQDIDDDIGMSDQQDEPLTPTFTLTNGKSIGLQITLTKAADLSPNTVLLDITSDDTVTQTIWQPADPTTLVVAGDHFCGLWKWHGQRTSHHSSLDMLVNDPLKQTYVTALNWNPTGEMLAVATYKNMTGSITMYNRDGSAIDLLPDLPRMITGLHWAPGGQRMMVVASDGERSEISLWNQNIRSDVFPFQRVVEGNICAVSWAGDDFIYASADSSIYNFSIKQNNVDSTRTYSSENKESWIVIKSMVLDRPLAVAVSNQTSKIWVPTHEIIQEGIHDGDITSLEIYSKAPLNTSDTKISFVLAATSSMDNTIKLWKIGLDSKRIDCLHKLSLGPYSPALVTTISPDSYAVASVSTSKLLIWNVDRGGTAIAKWNMPVNENEYDHDRMSDNDSYIPFDRSLSWDTDGKKLALGFGHKVAIINVQR